MYYPDKAGGLMLKREQFRRLPGSRCNVSISCLAWALGTISLLVLGTAQALAGVCPAPGAFAEGRIDSTWVGVVLNFTGEPGSPRTATVYSTMFTSEGTRLVKLATVEARGNGASDLHAVVIDDKLYFINERNVASSADFKHESFAFDVQRFSVRNGKLFREAEAVFGPSLIGYELVGPGTDGGGCDQSRFDASLEKAIEAGTLERVWTDTANPP
jgi:hypothetical protein